MEGGYRRQGWRLPIQAGFFWILLAAFTPGNNSKDDSEDRHLCIPKNSICNWTLDNDLPLTSGIPIIACRCLEMGLHIIGLTVSDVASTEPTQGLFNVTLEKVGIGLLELDSSSPEVLILLPLKQHISESVRNLILSFSDEKMQTLPMWGSSNNRSINITFSVPGICDLSVSVSNPHDHIIFIQCLPGNIRVGGSNIDGKPAFPLKMNHTSLWLPENNRNSSQDVGFGVHTSSDNITSLMFDFGDGTEIQVSIKEGSDEVEIITYHQYRKEGIYKIKVTIFNEFHGTEKELGPYYIEISQEGLGVFMNSSSVHKDEVILFANSFQRMTTGVYTRSTRDYITSVNKEPIVMHRFSPTSSYNVFLMVPNKANGCQDWVSVNVQYQMQAVSIFTNGTVFATDSEVTFFVLTNETSCLEFVWHFGDGSWERTTTRSVKKTYSVPKRYHVIVNAANQINSVASDIHTISIEREIVPNRLVSNSSALINSSVSFECRINFGTNVAYLWNFGDDTIHPGRWTESHIYKREGEFTVEVLIFNSVSIATLKKQVFIVSQPCQPPLVKNMGPSRVQIWRRQPLKLGVTFEAPIQCDISRGLNYSWSLIKSDGSLVLFPTALNKHRQTILLPSYFLEYGNYTALAKVKIEGTVVYSNYSVVIEVVSLPPVSVISEGTHLLISKTPFSIVVLNGSQSFDPDDPGTHLKYYWKCAPAIKQKHTCFKSPRYSLFNSSASVISFPASLLHDSYDQFLVTLMVSSGNRNSSEAQVFLSVQSGSTFRPLHISWVNFKDNSVNWNEEFSLQVKCEECTNMPNISYSWDLFLINATETNGMEVPFCRATDLLDSSSLGGAILTIPKSNSPSRVKQMTIPALTTTPFPRDASGQAIRQLAPSASVKTSISATSINITIGFHHANDTSHRESSSPSALEDPVEEGLLYPIQGLLEKTSVIRSTHRGKSASTELPQNSSLISDFEAFYSNIKEATEPSRGRQPGSISITELRENEETDTMSDSDDGYNLIDLSYSTENTVPLLMVDWSKSLINRAVFQNYTSSGITSRTVTFKPFFLRGGETYVIQASVVSRHSLLGKAQLYFTVNEVPKEMACQVQPIHGYEAYTVFSVFCMSGKADYHYEFSYQIGRSSKIPLYRGRDIQYYFTLPAGEIVDKYKVTVFTEITNRYGSKSHPCAVNVTVLPSFHRNISSLNDRPEDLYNSSLKNLTTLLLMGNYGEIRNYIIMLTRILNHFYTEDGSSTIGLQSQMRNLLISSVCDLSFQDQEEMADSVLMLNELISISKQVTLNSAVLIIKYIRKLIDHNGLSGQFVMNKELMSKLVFLASRAMEVKEKEKSRNVKYFREEGIKIIVCLLLNYVSSSKELQFNISTGQLEFQTSLHYTFHNSVQHVGSVKVYLPDALEEHISGKMELHSQCYISQLIYFKEYPYLVERVPIQIDGSMVTLSLYNCTNKRKINVQRLESPIRVVFEKSDAQDGGQNKTIFSLYRDKVNFHYFSGLPEASQESLQIVVEFSKTSTRIFPIMLLVRFSEKPTVSTFNVKQIRSWDEQVVQIYIPAVSLKDVASGYLSLLDADYDQKPTNKYLANVVNYTVSFHWIRCLFWDENGEWKSEGSYPQQGTTSQSVNCSYNHFTTFTVVRRKLSANFEISDVSLLKSIPRNLFPSILVMLFILLFAFLAIASKSRDLHEQKKDGYIFLQESSQARDKQFYVVIIDTGFRAPAQLTAKVHIVFYGEYEFSETRELYCPEKPLFERNSRHTFIISIPNNIGPLWKIHLWHDNSGCSPSWYISHVIVKDLIMGTSWFFPAECWLAVNKWEGKVDRELTPVKNGLGFRKLLYSKFTEYLEDFHMWISVYSRPSYSCFTHTERLTVCLFLVLGYMSINAALITMEQEEHFPEVGLPDVSVVSLMNGVLSIFIISPVALLLSLLFRLSERTTRNPSEDQCKSQRRSPTYSAKGHDFHQWTENSQNEYEQDTLEGFTLEASPRNENEEKQENYAASLRYSGHFGDYSTEPARPIPKGSHVHSNCSSEPCNGLEEPTPQKRMVLPLCLSYVAWVTCGLVSMACGLVTGLLGYRFDSSKCIQWIYSVFFSIVGCIFVAQPLVIFFVALALAWRKRDHKGFFIEALYEATKNLEYELHHLSKNHARCPSYCCTPNTVADFEKILLARKRARYLQWVHPPTSVQLKEARGRIRKEGLLQTAARNFFTYILMLFLLLFIIFGKISHHEYVLNQAIRNEFTRNAGNSFIEVKNANDWWNWSLTTLLDGLYWDYQNNTVTPKTQSGPLGGKCHLIGTSVIKQLKFTGQFSIPVEASSLVHPSQNQDNENILQSNPEKLKVTQTKRCLNCDDVENEDDKVSVVSLGRTRAKAYSVLINLKNSGWINKRTMEVSLHFVLYNPPTNLFTSVSLLAEVLPTGDITPSSFVESLSIYHIHSAVSYCIMFSELVFLVFSLIHLCFQMFIMIQKGILNYWQDSWNWLEMCIIGMSLCYFAHSIFHFILVVDVIDQFHKGFFQEFVDFNPILSWRQRDRCLQGILLFLLLIKCLHLLGIYKPIAPSLTMIRLSCSNIILPVLAGVLFTATYSYLGRFLFSTHAFPFRSFADSFQMLLLCFLGIKEKGTFFSLYKSNQYATVYYYGTLFITVIILWSGILRGTLIAFMQDAKRSFRSPRLVKFKDVADHTWEKVLSFLGIQRPVIAEEASVQDNNFYLDEFESLLDELLLRVNGLYYSLHYSPLEKPPSDQGEVEQKDETLAYTINSLSSESNI